jgi:hypothetical protein
VADGAVAQEVHQDKERVEAHRAALSGQQCHQAQDPAAFDHLWGRGRDRHEDMVPSRAGRCDKIFTRRRVAFGIKEKSRIWTQGKKGAWKIDGRGEFRYIFQDQEMRNWENAGGGEQFEGHNF